MDSDSTPPDATAAFCETCMCGRTFSQPGALHYHTRSCPKTKKRVSEALAKAKDAWTRKRRRLGTLSGDHSPETLQDLGSVATATSGTLDPSAIDVDAEVSVQQVFE
jgi:hypothetical protein